MDHSSKKDMVSFNLLFIKQNLLRYIRLEFVPWTKKSFTLLNLNIFDLLSTPFGIPHISGAVGKIFYTEDGN